NMNSLMGHCVNMIPMLSNVQGQWHFEQYLTQRKQDFKTALDNRHITFGTLLKHIRIDRGQSTLPLIPVTFNIDRELIGENLLEGLSAELTINTREYSSFDMIINISRVGESLTIDCDYNSALFQHDDINELLLQYQYIINTITLSPETRISDCDLSDPQLTIQQLDSFNASEADYPRTSTVHDLVLKQAQSTPDAIAIRFEDISITYAELINRVDDYARGLQAAGLKPGMFAGVMLDRGPEMMYTLMAIMRLGAAYIPIDPIFPEQRIQYMLSDSKTSLLVCEDRFRFICPESCQAFSTDQLQALANDNSSLPVQDNALPAYVIYTSGSTGLPKGVIMPQKALVNLLWSVKNQPGFTTKDSLLALTTISFDIAGLELYLPLISGGTLVLASSEISKDGDAIIQLIAKENITVLQATPATFRLLSGFGFKGHKNLKILCGGEPLPHDLAMELLPKCHSLWNMYGPTETCIWSSAQQIKNKDTKISIGRPLANTSILILDDRHRPLPKGKIGEIAIAGDGLAHGYLNKKELSAEKFIKHPLKDNERIYLSGDLGYVDSDDRLYCLGRSDNQVKVRGYRIETGEIESVILKNSNYREAVVVPKLFGKDDIRLVAFVKDLGVKNRNYKICKQTGLQLCLLEGEELEGLRNLLSKDLPDYMVPGIFMAINAMPLTPNAKTDRKFLTDLDISAMFQSGKSQVEDSGSKTTWSETELSIKPLWEAALGVKSASRLDDFFASGGHSLIAIELMHQIEQELGFKLPLSALFRKPSIAGLAQIINGETNGSGTYHYLVPVKPEGTNPPLYIVHGIGLEVMVFKDLASHMDASQPVYGVQAIGLSNNEFPPEKLEQIAAKYIQEIKAHNPKGPYLIAGHSAGSLLAYEIGRQLEKSGANIGMLAIFDYSLESTKKEISNGQKIIKYILNFFPALMHAFKMLIKYPKEAGKYYRTMIRLSINGILARFGKEIPDDDDPSREEFYKIMDAYISAFRQYEVMPFYGKVDLFRSEKKLYFLKDRKFLGWHPYAVKGVVIHEVEGDHDHMILGEYSEGFARKLQKAINRCLKMN
ncbi:MAG: non-ribosomal peptide synthetase, partial [Chitinophagaceae bacterium]